MDPNEALQEIRRLASAVLNGTADSDDIERLAERVQDLDNWIKRGGFLPAAWYRAERGA